MLYSLLHYFGGYCKIKLKGSRQERFLNVCVSRKIFIWKLRKKDGVYLFFVSRAALKELEEASVKTGCSYEIVQKKGLPFLFVRYKKRKIFFFSCMISMVILYSLSLFLWQIKTVGCYRHSAEELMDYLEEKGIKSGKRLSSISCHQLEEQIRKDFQDIAWVSCDLQGTMLTVTIKETLDHTALQESGEDFPCNLIASKKGKIDTIVVRSGSAKVKKGDKVKTGDVLISGEIGLYDDGGQLTETALVRASGEITAITKRYYEDSFPLLHYEKQYTGERVSSYQLLVGKKLLSIPGKEVNYRYYDEKTRQTIWHIGPQLYLPVTFFTTTKAECRITEERYTREEAIRTAKKRLDVFLQEYKEKGVAILKNNVKINCDENTCTAKGKIVVRERFGKIQEINSPAAEMSTDGREKQE